MKRLTIGWIRKPRPYLDVIGDCIICTSHKPSKRGYPRVNRNGKIVNIARLVLNRRYGEQPASIKARHTCDNTLCINPDHLICGTQAENVSDSVRRNRNHKGERTGGSKLKERDVIEIKRLLSLGVRQKEIAKRFGVIRQNISLIKRGLRWKHLII